MKSNQRVKRHSYYALCFNNRRTATCVLGISGSIILQLSLWMILAAYFAPCTMAQSNCTYRNPIDSEQIRDPQIVKVGKEWYLTGTSSPFFESLGQSPGVKIWKSRDLTHWSLVTIAVKPSVDRWYRNRFWAPELFPFKNKWYLTFNCPYPDVKGTQSVGLAVADSISGPYRVLTQDKPLTKGNDATLFEDDDQKVYLFRSGLSAIEVDLPNVRTVGEPFKVLQPGGDGDWDGTSKDAPKVGLEGPSVFKHNGIYYLLYASWGRGYEEGYATAPTVSGPWTKYADNPIYGAQDEEWSKRYRHIYTQRAEVPYKQVGHGSPFIGPDGTLWFGCHGYLKGKDQQPHLIVTPVTFDAHGTMHMTLTWTTEHVNAPNRFRLHLDGTRLATPTLTVLAVRGKMR